MLHVDSGVERELRDRSRAGDPEEVCGVLGGEYGPAESRVSAVEAAPNVADSPRTRYRLDPAAQLEAMDRLRERGLDVVGFYHSHPRGPTEPSPTDADLATWKGYSYVIVTWDGEQWEVGSWRWRGDGFERESTD